MSYFVDMIGLDERTVIFLRTLPFFKGMDDKVSTTFFNNMAVHDHNKGQTLFLAGDVANRFFVILSGWVKIFRATSQGDESVLTIFTRGDVFGEACVFEGATYPFSAEIAESARLIEINGSFLRDCAKQNPDILSRIMATMSREMTKLQMENEHLSIMTAPQRVGCLLLQLSSGMIGKGGTFSFPYDKSLAASRLGMKPETFSRALAQLKPLGVTVRGTDIQIESFQKLVEDVCENCSSINEECRGSRGYKGCDGNTCLHNCSGCKSHT